MIQLGVTTRALQEGWDGMGWLLAEGAQPMVGCSAWRMLIEVSAYALSRVLAWA